MTCDYCYDKNKSDSFMDIDTVRKAIDLASQKSAQTTGIVFFGGEPLLCKDLIYNTVEYCKWKEKRNEGNYQFKMTTNGTLLDMDFLDFSKRENVLISLSHDGVQAAHDKHRTINHNEGTFNLLSEKIDMLLSSQPYSFAMMVINPDTAKLFMESVEYLYNKGFRYIMCTVNYLANWTDKTMHILKNEYKKLSKFYFKKMKQEEKLYLSPFDVKIISHVRRDTFCYERCELGKRQVSISPDGCIYPCIQFVNDEKYCIGDVNRGIDSKKQKELYDSNESGKESCNDCAIKERCNHYCGCINKAATGSLKKVSPMLCEHERMLLPIADRLANKLFKKQNPIFIQKFYNDMYPFISLIEDFSK